MITALNIKNPDNTCVTWWPRVKWLQGQKRIEFKSGVNILFGPNGSGKSTVLKALARMTACEQGGVQTVTRDWLFRVMSGSTIYNGLSLEQDGSPVAYCNVDEAVGLLGGLAGFDTDFFSMGAMNATFKGSAGEATLRRLDQTIAYVLDPVKYPIPPLTWKIPKDRLTGEHASPRDKRLAKFVDTLFKVPKKTKTVGPTVLLDEPTKSVAMPLDIGLWQRIDSFSKQNNVQVIVATHSPFALLNRQVHLIETEPGYADKCREHMLRAVAMFHAGGQPT